MESGDPGSHPDLGSLLPSNLLNPGYGDDQLLVPRLWGPVHWFRAWRGPRVLRAEWSAAFFCLGSDSTVAQIGPFGADLTLDVGLGQQRSWGSSKLLVV